jgi:hypothetical protein
MGSNPIAHDRAKPVTSSYMHSRSKRSSIDAVALRVRKAPLAKNSFGDTTFGTITKKIHVPYDHCNHRLGFFIIQRCNSFDNCTRLWTSAPMHNVLVTCQRKTFLVTMLAYLLLHKFYVTYTCVLLTTLDYARCWTWNIFCIICIKQPRSSTPKVVFLRRRDYPFCYGLV